MSKLNEALVMMAEQKETFEVNGKTFQIIEVKEAEQPKVRATMADPNAKPVEVVLEQTQPDYSHLVGKFVRCCKNTFDGHTSEKWYLVNDAQGCFISIENNHNRIVEWNINLRTVRNYFDLTNPKDENPDEVKKILVPSEVRIMSDSSKLGIEFGKGQFLRVIETEESYLVCCSRFYLPIQCELIKCERAELVKGDLAFRTDYEILNLTDMIQYCVIIDNNSYCYIDDNDIRTRCSKYTNWYKLIPVNND